MTLQYVYYLGQRFHRKVWDGVAGSNIVTCLFSAMFDMYKGEIWYSRSLLNDFELPLLLTIDLLVAGLCDSDDLVDISAVDMLVDQRD